MRVTKHEHATLRLEQNGETLIVDPGGFTPPLSGLQRVVAVVITHEHGDHWSAEHLAAIRQASPEATIFAPEGAASAIGDSSVQIVSPGDAVSAGSFTLRFFGGRHAVIHESIPVVDNVGVLVNDELYYPGDSYAVPEGVEVKALAAPLGAPWLKISEAIDFVLAVAPRRAFGTHDMTLSAIGQGSHHDRLKWATEQNGGEYLALTPGSSIDL